MTHPRGLPQLAGLADKEPVFMQRSGPPLQILNDTAGIFWDWRAWDESLTEDDRVAGRRKLEELSSCDPLEFQISDARITARLLAYFEHGDARCLLEELSELAPTADVSALEQLLVLLGQHEPTAELLSEFLTPELLGQIRRRDTPDQKGGS